MILLFVLTLLVFVLSVLVLPGLVSPDLVLPDLVIGLLIPSWLFVVVGLVGTSFLGFVSCLGFFAGGGADFESESEEFEEFEESESEESESEESEESEASVDPLELDAASLELEDDSDSESIFLRVGLLVFLPFFPLLSIFSVVLVLSVLALVLSTFGLFVITVLLGFSLLSSCFLTCLSPPFVVALFLGPFPILSSLSTFFGFFVCLLSSIKE